MTLSTVQHVQLFVRHGPRVPTLLSANSSRYLVR